MLQKLSKCEFKPAQCGNLTICLPLIIYVKSHFGEMKTVKNVIFITFSGFEL